MFEVTFLSALAFVWIVFATVQDLRSREIANWLNFSLIVFALGFRFFYSLFSEVGYGFFYQGLIGFGIFFGLGHLMYYGKFFAGGDAKLMMALGSVLPFTGNFLTNVKIFVAFLTLFLLAGAIFILFVSFVLSLKNFKAFRKEFVLQLQKKKIMSYSIFLIGILVMLLGFFDRILILSGIFIFLIPYLYFYTKAVDEVCMIRKVKPENLTEGDWLYRDVKIGDKNIEAKWDGLTLSEIRRIKSAGKEVFVRYGIEFTPVFLMSFLALVYFWFAGLVEGLWLLLGF